MTTEYNIITFLFLLIIAFIISFIYSLCITLVNLLINKMHNPKLNNRKLYSLLSNIFNCPTSYFVYNYESDIIISNYIPGIIIYKTENNTFSINIRTTDEEYNDFLKIILDKLNAQQNIIVLGVKKKTFFYSLWLIEFDFIDSLKKNVRI